MFLDIKLDKTTIIFLYIILFCGLFKNIVILGLLIILHELGHALMGIFLKWKVKRIDIYPYGGNTCFTNIINKPLLEEILVLVSGPTAQIISYIILSNIMKNSDVSILKTYHYALLFFNLLPIYPLDGGRLILIIISFFKPYFMAFKSIILWSIILSIFFILFSFYCNKLSISIMFLIVFIKCFNYYKKRDLMYNNFLLDRYLNDYKFNKRKVIDNPKLFYKDNYHIIKRNSSYITEKCYLKVLFSKKM